MGKKCEICGEYAEGRTVVLIAVLDVVSGETLTCESISGKSARYSPVRYCCNSCLIKIGSSLENLSELVR